VPNPFVDAEGAEMTHWFHPLCAALKRPEPMLEFLTGATESVEDGERLRRHAEAGVAHRRLPRVDAASRAPSGRATCRHCKTMIDKGEWRITLVYYEDGRFAPSGYIHLSCVRDYIETTDITDRLQQFSPDLTDADLSDIAKTLAPRP
jgi:hypothetical protein